LVLLGRKLNFSLLLFSVGFLYFNFVFMVSEKIIVNSYENRTLEVRHYIFILFLQNTRCKLHIKCIINSSPNVLLTFFQSLLLFFIAHFIFLVRFVFGLFIVLGTTKNIFQFLAVSFILTILQILYFFLIFLIFSRFFLWRSGIIIIFIIIRPFQIRFFLCNSC